MWCLDFYQYKGLTIFQVFQERNSTYPIYTLQQPEPQLNHHLSVFHIRPGEECGKENQAKESCRSGWWQSCTDQLCGLVEHMFTVSLTLETFCVVPVPIKQDQSMCYFGCSVLFCEPRVADCLCSVNALINSIDLKDPERKSTIGLFELFGESFVV